MKKLLLTSLFISLVLFAWLQGGFIPWFLLGFVGPILIYCIGFLQFVDLHQITFHREVETKTLTANQSVKVTITIDNKNWYPIFFLYLEERMSDSLLQTVIYHQPRTFFYFITKKKWEWTYTLNEVSRGKHVFNGLTVRLGDLLGLSIHHYECNQLEEILVYPEILPLVLEEETITSNGGLPFPIYGPSFDLLEPICIRKYNQGDPLSWVHWKSSAKRQQTMTKVFDNKQTNDVTIILDVLASHPLERAIRFIASYICLSTNDVSNQLITVHSSHIKMIENSKADMMEHLALLEKEPITNPLFLPSLLAKLNEDTFIYLVLPRVTEAWLELLSKLSHPSMTLFVLSKDLMNLNKYRELFSNKQIVIYYLEETSYRIILQRVK